MKIASLFTLAITAFSISACAQKNVKEWSDAKIESWFNKSQWTTKLACAPESSVDKRQFVEQNILNPKAWKAAYEFLSGNGFDTMALGRRELTVDGTFATVSDYMTKDSSQFEAHKKYIDIQYVAVGREYILKSTLDGITPLIPYSEQKDIELFSSNNYTTILADPTHVVVLFPSDGHKPCMSVDGKKSVRKIVVKIPFVQ